MGEGRIGRLAATCHPSNHRDRAYTVVPALDAPTGDSGIVHGAAQREVALHVPLKVVENGPLSPETPDEQRMVTHVIENREPVPGRGLRVGSIRPELGEHAGVVASWDVLGRIRLAGTRIQRTPWPEVAASLQIVKIRQLRRGL